MEKSQKQIENMRANSLEAAAGETSCRTLPGQVFLELTRRCNFRCFMCPRTSAGMGTGGADMGMDLFRTVERELFPTAVLAALNGLGDSLLMDAWHDVLRAVGRYKLHPLLVTNGQNLDYRTIDFFARHEGILRLSVDAAAADAYRRLRGGASMDRLKDALAVIRRRNDGDSGISMALEFVTVLSTVSAGEIGGILDLAAEYCAETVHMQHLVVLKEGLERYSLCSKPEEGNQVLWRARVLARKLGIRLVAPDFFDTEGAAEMRRFFPTLKEVSAADRILQEHHWGFPETCVAPWSTVFIEFNGNVKPCCVSEEVMGNLRDMPFGEIWNGPAYKSLRSQLAGKEPLSNANCRRCYAFSPTVPGMLTRYAEADRPVVSPSQGGCPQ